MKPPQEPDMVHATSNNGARVCHSLQLIITLERRSHIALGVQELSWYPQVKSFTSIPFITCASSTNLPKRIFMEIDVMNSSISGIDLSTQLSLDWLTPGVSFMPKCVLSSLSQSHIRSTYTLPPTLWSRTQTPSRNSAKSDRGAPSKAKDFAADFATLRVRPMIIFHAHSAHQQTSSYSCQGYDCYP